MFGATEMIELKPNGSAVTVTDTNKVSIYSRAQCKPLQWL